jgi:hypothetical protein
MWKGKPIGDGTPFEAERALKPCEFNSRSFRLVLDECAIGRAAKVLDFQSGQVGSTPTWHSVSSSNLQVWANGKPAAFEAVHWRFESFRLCCVNKTTLRSSNCWSLHLALNQKLAGSIPASGAVAVLYWFRNLAVNQVYVGSIPIGHL